jgi:hypothetical protein
MSEKSSTLYNRRDIEYKIFNDSFRMIDKYVSKSNVLQKAFNIEYNYAMTKRDGFLDWNRVLPNLKSGHNSNAYINAIQRVGPLVKSAKISHRKSGDSEDDRKLFESLTQNVVILIDRRIQELSPKFAIKGWVLWKGENFKRHEHTINAWKQFQKDIQYNHFYERLKHIMNKWPFILLLLLLVYKYFYSIVH